MFKFHEPPYRPFSLPPLSAMLPTLPTLLDPSPAALLEPSLSMMDPLLTGTKSVIRVVVHIDTLCPWCYIQKRSLDVATTRYKAAYPDLDFEIIFKPFILNPLLRDGMSIIPPLFKKYSLLLLLYELYKKKET